MHLKKKSAELVQMNCVTCKHTVFEKSVTVKHAALIVNICDAVVP